MSTEESKTVGIQTVFPVIFDEFLSGGMSYRQYLIATIASGRAAFGYSEDGYWEEPDVAAQAISIADEIIARLDAEQQD